MSILFKKFTSALKLAAMVSVALVIFAGCSKDEDKPNGPGGPGVLTENGTGTAAFQGKNYTLKLASAVCMYPKDEDNPKDVFLLSFMDAYNNTNVSMGVYVTSTSRNELTNVEIFEENHGAGVFNYGEEKFAFLRDIQIQSTKSGKSYDITITTTAHPYGDENSYPFSFTWKGEIQIY